MPEDAYGELGGTSYDDAVRAARDFSRDLLRIPAEEEVHL